MPPDLTSRLLYDFRNWQQTESVILESANGLQRAVIAVVKRSALSAKEQAVSDAAYVGGMLGWSLPAVLVAPTGITPAPGCTLIQQGGGDPFLPGRVGVSNETRWIVQTADLQRSRTKWRLTALNLRIVYELRDTINIERATIIYDSAGAVILLWPSGPPPNGGLILYPNMLCKVQPTDLENVDERGIRGPQQKYDVTLDSQVTVTTVDQSRAATQYDRIAWQPQGAAGPTMYLDILDVRNPQSIRELPVIGAVRKTGA
jgi:hypothetical protein